MKNDIIPIGTRVIVHDYTAPESRGAFGVITGTHYDNASDLYVIEFDDKNLGDIILTPDEFDII